MSDLVARFFGHYARWASAHPWIPLLLIASTLACSASSFGRIRFETNYEHLAPSDMESLGALREARRRVGGTDTFLIAIQSPDPTANVKAAKALSRRIAAWDETEWVMDRLDLGFMRDSALLYLDLESLREFIDLLELKIQRVQCERRGNCDTADFRTEQEVARDERRLTELANRYARHVENTAGPDRRIDESHPELRDALISEDGVTTLVVAGLRGSPNDRDFAVAMRDRGEALIRELGPDSFHPELVATVSGAYGAEDGLDLLPNALRALVPWSVGALLIVVAIVVRRWNAPIVIVGSSSVGFAWSMALFGAISPVINPLVASVLLVLLVVASSISVRFYLAVLGSLDSEGELSGAFLRAAKTSVPDSLLSSLVTAAGLATLFSAQTPGLAAIAGLAAAGSLLCFCAAYIVIPPLWGFADRLRTVRPSNRALRERLLSRCGKRTAVWTAVILAVLLAWRLPAIELDGDLSDLRVSAAGLAIDPSRAMRIVPATSPAVLLGDDVRGVERARRALLQRRDAGDARIAEVIGLETYIPGEQGPMLEEIERLRELLEPLKTRRIPEVYRTELEEITRLSRVTGPVGLSDLPVEARRMLTERDGTIGRFALLYHNLAFGEIDEVQRFREGLARSRSDEDRPVRIACSHFLYSDIADTLREDGVRGLVCSAVIVFLLLTAGLRSLRGALACVVVVALGVGAGLGVADLLYWRLGVLEQFALPLALAMGVHGTVGAFRPTTRTDPATPAEGAEGRATAALLTGSMVMACLACLPMGGHRILSSIAQIALATTGLTLIAAILIPLGASQLLHRR